MAIVNAGFITQPVNWITILLMLVIAGIAGHLLLSYFKTEPATSNASN